MLKVCIVSGPFGKIGGIERFILELNNRLCDKVKFTLVVPRAYTKTEDAEKWLKSYPNVSSIKWIEYERRKLGKLNMPKDARYVTREFEDSDVIYFTTLSPVSNFYLYTVAVVKYGSKLIYGSHTKYVAKEVVREKNRVKMYANRFRRWIMLNSANTIHVVNRDDLEEFSKEGRRVFYAPPMFAGLGRRSIIHRGNKFVALLVARLDTYNKGLDILIDIVHRKQMKDIEFRIVGEGPDRKYFEEECRGLRNIKILGQLNENALEREYEKAKLFVFPSRFENFGLALLEAQMRGLPAVAFDITGPRDIIRKGQGALVEPFSADRFAKSVLQYYNMWKGNRMKYKNMMKDIVIDISRRFNAKTTAEKMYRVFKEVADESKFQK